MMYTNKISIFKRFLLGSTIPLFAVFILTSGWKGYQPYPLKPVITDLLPTFSLEHRQVQVSAKAMTQEESKRSFGHDLISKEIQPIQLTIENNTSDEYSLCPSSVDLSRVDPSDIAAKILKSTIPRGIAYQVASFLFWPFMIPSAINSIRAFKHYKDLKKDLEAKSMRDEVIAPYSTFHRVLFVPLGKFETTFKVTLIELESLSQKEFQTTVKNVEGTAEEVQEEKTAG